MADNAAALQRIRSRHGDDIWQNTYRFAESGVYRIRKKPARADEKHLAPHGEQPEKFSFMGLKGDFDIYIDTASRIPVQVSAKISRIGKIHIRLQTVAY